MLKRRATLSVVLLILVVPSLAKAAPAPALARCLEQLARTPDGEAPALCLYELATGTDPEQAAAARRLAELAAEHPQSPWFLLYLGRIRWQTRDPAGVREAEGLYRRSAELASRRGLAEAELGARRGLHRILRDAGRLKEARAEMERAVRIAEGSGLPDLRLRADMLRAQAQLAGGGAAAGDGTGEAQARYGMLSGRMLELHEMPSESGRKETLELARSALRAARAAGNPSYEVQSLWMLGALDTGAEAKAHLER